MSKFVILVSEPERKLFIEEPKDNAYFGALIEEIYKSKIVTKVIITRKFYEAEVFDNLRLATETVNIAKKIAPKFRFEIIEVNNEE